MLKEIMSVKTRDKISNEDESRLVINNNEMKIEGLKELATNGRKYLISNPLVVHLLVIIFGISAWIAVNGIYIQLPLLVITAPEGWNLAAYLVVVIQAANVGPATYTLVRKFTYLNESLCIFLLLLTGSLSMIVLAFFYQTTYYIGKNQYSLTLFVCSFFIALVGCTSSVLFMPYLRNSSEKYLISYFIGEGLSGVLPSVVALLQGVGGNPECMDYGNGTIIEISSEPRFSTRDYFIFIFTILLLTLCTFRLLQYLPSIKIKQTVTSVCINNSPSFIANDEQSKNNENRHNVDIIIMNEYRKNNDIPEIVQLSHTKGITITRIIYLHILVGFVCFLGNGFLPGIQTYSCLPYGNVAFHLTVTLANIANPTACLIYLWVNTVNLKVLDILTFIGTITCTYAIYLAVMSPIPPLRDSILGVIFAVLTWIILTGIISYIKLFITSTVRKKLGPSALIGIGIVMQAGSACGALLAFGLINYTTLFRQQTPCTAL